MARINLNPFSLLLTLLALLTIVPHNPNPTLDATAHNHTNNSSPSHNNIDYAHFPYRLFSNTNNHNLGNKSSNTSRRVNPGILVQAQSWIMPASFEFGRTADFWWPIAPGVNLVGMYVMSMKDVAAGIARGWKMPLGPCAVTNNQTHVCEQYVNNGTAQFGGYYAAGLIPGERYFFSIFWVTADGSRTGSVSSPTFIMELPGGSRSSSLTTSVVPSTTTSSSTSKSIGIETVADAKTISITDGPSTTTIHIALASTFTASPTPFPSNGTDFFRPSNHQEDFSKSDRSTIIIILICCVALIVILAALFFYWRRIDRAIANDGENNGDPFEDPPEVSSMAHRTTNSFGLNANGAVVALAMRRDGTSSSIAGSSSRAMTGSSSTLGNSTPTEQETGIELQATSWNAGSNELPGSRGGIEIDGSNPLTQNPVRSKKPINKVSVTQPPRSLTLNTLLSTPDSTRFSPLNSNGRRSWTGDSGISADSRAAELDSASLAKKERELGIGGNEESETAKYSRRYSRLGCDLETPCPPHRGSKVFELDSGVLGVVASPVDSLKTV